MFYYTTEIIPRGSNIIKEQSRMVPNQSINKHFTGTYAKT